MQAGWKLWLLVALLKFTVIPLEKCTLFGSTVGLYPSSKNWLKQNANSLQVLGYLYEFVGDEVIRT